MDTAILVNEQIDTGREFAEEFNKYYVVDVFFWINPAESSEWKLYLASPEINDSNLDVAYTEVLRLVGSGMQMWLDAFQIKLLSSDDKLAMKAKEIRDRHRAPLATRYNGSSIAGIPIGSAYIYPSLESTATLL
jgi:hypothetical protein